MRLGSLEITFHRTVRVADGRTPSNLPPSLGRMRLHSVKQYRKNCPKSWDDEAFFMALHDTEAMWMSFTPCGAPSAILVGAGGINALNGEKLGTVLAKDNYMVAPPQPWLDGWKDQDGTVYQFVATPHKAGEGLSVGEQLIGKESKTGAIGIAVFDPMDPGKLKPAHAPHEWYGYSPVGGACGQMIKSFDDDGLESMNYAAPTSSLHTNSMKRKAPASLRADIKLSEMGVGKGGKIIQKIYPDPYGVEVWKKRPAAIFAVYLVDAKTAAEITGEKVASPAVNEDYKGAWFGLQDNTLGDVAGSDKFTGLKSATFPGDTSNVNADPQTEAALSSKETA